MARLKRGDHVVVTNGAAAGCEGVIRSRLCPDRDIVYITITKHVSKTQGRTDAGFYGYRLQLIDNEAMYVPEVWA